MFGLFNKKTDDAIWLATARKQIESIRTISEALAQCYLAISKDPVDGWRSGAGQVYLKNFETYRLQYEFIQSIFNEIGSPRSSKELNQIKKNLDTFFAFCFFAFYWGKTHYADASGAPGRRAAYETGIPKKMAVRRVTGNGTKFCNNAGKAVALADAILDKLESS